MEASMEKLASGVVVRLSGHLDSEAAPNLARTLTEAMDADAPRLIVDMADVEFMSSACLREFLKAYKRVQAEGRFMEVIRTRPEVRKVLLVVGLDELLPLGEGTMQITDVLKQRGPHNERARRNAREFLGELFDALDIPRSRAKHVIDDIFLICETAPTEQHIEGQLKDLLRDMDLGARIGESLKDRSALIHKQIAAYVGEGSILDVGAGDGRIAAAFADNGREVQLIDVVDYNQTELPFELYDGHNIPFPDKSFDYAFVITVLHHCDDPLQVLREVMRVTRKRIIVNESVYLNEAHRRFNMFFDWFYNRVLHDDVPVPFNFNSPEGWEHVFAEEGLRVAASEDIGLDQVTVPEYHWMYVLDLPDAYP